jgi:lipopolysaccharide export system protein LptA
VKALVALPFLMLLALPAQARRKPKAAPAASPVASLPPEAMQPIAINAKHFEIGRDKTGVFTGNVVAKQGEVTIRAQEVVASYSAQAKAVVRAIAKGGVTVTSQEKVGQAERAEFDNDARTVVLSGEPRLWEDNNLMEGERIVFHVDDGTVECFECHGAIDPERLGDEAKKRVPTPTGTP